MGTKLYAHQIASLSQDVLVITKKLVYSPFFVNDYPVFKANCLIFAMYCELALIICIL